MANKIMGVVRTGHAQDSSVPWAQVGRSPFRSTVNGGEAEWPSASSSLLEDESHPVTAAEVAAIVRQVMSEMRVYVLESDITEAQNAVKGVVEQTYF